MAGPDTHSSSGKPYTNTSSSDSGGSAPCPPLLLPSGLRRLRHFAAKALEKDPVAAAEDVIAVGPLPCIYVLTVS
jgi:hypothetical protein